jgi:putative lipoprotein
MTAPLRSFLLLTLVSVLACGSQPQTPQPQPLPAHLDPPPPDLGGTSWQLVKFSGGDESILIPEDKAKYTIAFGTDGRVSTRIDCNRGTGTWKSPQANQLEFSPLALSLAMCQPARISDRLAKDWRYVRSYIVKDGHLFLSLMADAGIYEFQPVGTVIGTATYRERMALPPGAVFEAALEDVSRADAAAEVLGTTRVDSPGNPPIPFQITYDPSRIDRAHRYAVRGRIVIEGNLFFATDQQYPVLTAGAGNQVELLLKRTSTGATMSLENTYWKLTNLGGTQVTVAPGVRELHLILNSGTRRAGGLSGCNQFGGSYEIRGDQLILGPMAGTLMACPGGMEMEQKFLDALKRVKSYKLIGNQLELLDETGNAVARFEGLHM